MFATFISNITYLWALLNEQFPAILPYLHNFLHLNLRQRTVPGYILHCDMGSGGLPGHIFRCDMGSGGLPGYIFRCDMGSGGLPGYMFRCNMGSGGLPGYILHCNMGSVEATVRIFGAEWAVCPFTGLIFILGRADHMKSYLLSAAFRFFC